MKATDSELSGIKRRDTLYVRVFGLDGLTGGSSHI